MWLLLNQEDFVLPIILVELPVGSSSGSINKKIVIFEMLFY
jgi:hypothetical protein